MSWIFAIFGIFLALVVGAETMIEARLAAMGCFFILLIISTAHWAK